MNSYNGFTPAQRMKAYEWLKEQWRLGTRQKGTKCRVCGQTRGVLMAHSEDYSEPYGDHIGRYTLCFICHMMIHCRFRCPEKFAAYARIVSNGGRFEALRGHDWEAFRAKFLVASALPPCRQTGEPNTMLATILQEGRERRWAPGSSAMGGW